MKKILVASVIILILLLLFLWLISQKKSEEHKDEITTTIPASSSVVPFSKKTPTPIPVRTVNELQKVVPYQSDSFDFTYSTDLEKYILTKKTANADAALNDWAKKNSISNLIGGKNIIVRDVSNPNFQTSTNQAMSTLSEEQKGALNKIRISPPTNDSFSVTYSDEFDVFIVQKKNEKADKEISTWAQNNKISGLINDPNVFIVSNLPADEYQENTNLKINQSYTGINISQAFQGTPSVTPVIAQSYDLMKSIFGMLPTQGPTTPPNSSTPIPSGPPQGESITPVGPPPSSNGLVYYAQCLGQYDDYPLPDGGTFCYAGCGSATAAMVLSSYISSSYIPPKVIGLYKQKGYYLGTRGSSIDDGKRIVESQGVKTSDYLFVQKLYTADIAAPIFKHYIDAGWTIFVVTNFCDASKGGCGHLFWVVNVDSNGIIWGYDAAYGQRQIPLNENKKFPYPMYKAAFAVAKP